MSWRRLIAAVAADPCRFVEFVADYRNLIRLWHSVLRRGTGSLLEEFDYVPVSKGPPASPVFTPNVRQNGILIIDRALPEYDRHAGARAAFAYVRLLVHMGFPIWYLPNDQLRREPYASELEGMGVHLLIGQRYGCGGWRRWLEQQKEDIAFILLHRPNIAVRYLRGLRRTTRAKIVYFAHDLRYLREERQFKVSGDPFCRKESEYWLKREQHILSQVDVAYFFSDDEVSACRSWSSAAVRRIPMFPAKERSAGLALAAQRERNSLLFVGGFAHQPNVDAMLWFVADILPLVRMQLPDVRLHIVGGGGAKEIMALQRETGVTLHGRLDDTQLAGLYSSVCLAVVPVRFGAGVKGKVLEALAYGLPVVTTPVGAEGIPDGNSVLVVGNTAEELAQLIVTLCQDSAHWAALQSAIAHYSQSHFSAEEACAILALDLVNPQPDSRRGTSFFK